MRSVLGEVVHPTDVQHVAAHPERGRRGAGRGRGAGGTGRAGNAAQATEGPAQPGRGQDTLTTLPNGIHSGLRREKCYGMFFYFQAPRADGRQAAFLALHRRQDARDQENRYEIAQMISCLPDEPRYIGDQDVFVLQDKVIDQILAADREAEARAAAPPPSIRSSRP